MAAVLNAVIPIFALILIGYLAAKKKILSHEATHHLNLYVVWLALPALLFQAMATTSWQTLYQPGFIGASMGSMLLVFIVYLIWQKNNTSLADRSINSLSASYSNTGYMGLPLCSLVFGPEGLTAAIISMILTACVLFAMAIVFIELGVQSSPSLGNTLRKTALSLAKNPLIAAPVLGGLVAATPFNLPAPMLEFTRLLGASASPCALVTIGLFLAQTDGKGLQTGTATLLGLKLLLLPALTAVLAFYVFDMPLVYKQAAILLAALPTGTGPFMLATLYKRNSQLVSQVIFLSTVISVLSISLLIALFQATA
ncbi:MAG: AEC family transporter [Alcaligenaceae bacterium]|nr:AEC family transporter [Alcaligenaceae bacterium]